MSQLKFIADTMLGTLAKKLRLLGIDTTYHGEADDSELKYLVRSRNLILLTKDRALAQSQGDRAWIVVGSDVKEEFRSIAKKLATCGVELKPFSRCLDCNDPLQFIDPQDAEGRVPPYILQTQISLYGCPACKKVYWEGTHRQRMEAEVKLMRKMILCSRG